jgi:hypothetical protein
LALLISGASYYATNIRVSNDASARIADLNIGSVSRDDPNDEAVVATVVNAGNRPAIVTSAQFMLSATNPDDGRFGEEAVTDPGVFPLLLPPKDLKLVEMKIPARSLIESLDQGAAIADSDDEQRRRFYAGFSYSSVDVSGRAYDAWSGIQIDIEVSPTGLHSLGATHNDGHFPPMPLFE